MPQTPLHSEHARLGASFTDFGGWDMPVRYTSDLAEHEAVRTDAGLFDISHMGSAIANGKAKYSLICNEAGTIIDDLIVYRLADDRFLVIANAGNRMPVVEALKKRASEFGFAGVEDKSDEFALLAVQGPNATSKLQKLTETDLSALPYYSIAEGNVDGVAGYFCRTGYTGEDGFEVLIPAESAVQVFNALLNLGIQA
ncbi:MAG: glycine cleavage system protein T, partial [Micrococcales bacterium]|nr:glycine cleavage system protein T [Micrococcales bacterium]